jgi:photosystem II stability/assembly factor-like uncharacterized protein
VAAVLLAAVLIGTSLLRPDRQPPASQSPSPSLSSSPSPSTPGPSQSASPSPSPATSTSPSGQGAVGGLVPAGFWAADLTWVSTDEGWALGTAPCTQATCTVIAHTTDGGKTWARVAAPPAGLEPGAGCLSNCVKHLRFANSQVGYAYGSDRLFLTTDGGRTWSRQPGHADALEVGDGTVIRVTSKDPQCLPGCFYQVQRAAVGSSTWQDVSLPPGARTAGVEMVRSGPVAAIATYANTAGGAQDATSVLFVSADDGASWSARHDPCPSRNGGDADGEVDTKAITIGADRSISVLCTPRGGPAGGQHTMTSTDGGNHFVAAPATLSGIVTKLGAASAQVLFASTDHLYRSTDGGRHWEQVYGVSFVGFLTVPDQQLSYLGFQTTTVGRAVEMYAGDNPASLGSAMVWTTTDAGKTWKSYPFR